MLVIQTTNWRRSRLSLDCITYYNAVTSLWAALAGRSCNYVSNISLDWSFTDVFKAGRPSTSWTVAHLHVLLMSPAVSVFTLSVATHSSFHDIVTASLVVWHSLLSARWPETLCLTISTTQHLVMTSLEQHWRHTFSRSVRTCSALEAPCLTALYKCTVTYFL